jgi:hypothetical protein
MVMEDYNLAAAVVLNPKYPYTMVQSQEMFRGLKDTFGRMTVVHTAV